MDFNIGAFPLDSMMFASYTRLFKAGESVALAAMPSFIMGRALWGMVSAKNAEEQIQILKDAFLAIIMISSFLSFLQILMEIPSLLSNLFEEQGTYSLRLTDQEVPYWNDIVNYVTIFCFWVSAVFYAVAILVVSAVAAYIILFGTMFRSYTLIKATVWLLLLISCWPLVWYALNMAIKSLAQDDSFVNGIIVTTLNILKAFSPLIATFLALKNPVSHFAKQSAGKALTMAGGAAGVATSVVSKLGGQPLLDQFKTKQHRVSDGIGSMLSKTIPTMGLAAGSIGTAASSVYQKRTPHAIKKPLQTSLQGASHVKRFFSNTTDPFTGKVLAKSSPFERSLRSASRQIRSSFSSNRNTNQSQGSENQISRGFNEQNTAIKSTKPVIAAAATNRTIHHKKPERNSQGLTMGTQGFPSFPQQNQKPQVSKHFKTKTINKSNLRTKT